MDKNKDKHNTWRNQDTDDLFGAILKLRNVDEARRFFRDLLTENELVEFGQRWKVARMLAGLAPYTRISQETGMSSTTIARVHKWLKKGMGGYKIVLERLKLNH
jgi:TrpR-related protein YerC/YecD